MEGPRVAQSGMLAAKFQLSRQQLLEEAIWPVFVASCGLGLGAVLWARSFPQVWQGAVLGLSLMVGPLGAWVLAERHYRAGVWFLVGLWLACASACLAWLPGTLAPSLMALPVGLATLFIGTDAGFLTGLVTSLLSLLAAHVSSPILAGLGIVWLTIWGVFLLGWLSSRPTQTAIQWSWASYDQARAQLELARERQAELKQATEDLVDANVQMGRLNQLLGTARRVAEEAERAKAEFAANVSHELRTPLNMILGFSEMILHTPQAYGSIPSALLADLEVIHRNSQHLSSLIDDVLDLSRIEAGQVAFARERVAISDIVKAAVVAVRPLYESKHLYLQVEIQDGLPLVFCDRTRIRQVLLNLLSNAGRFTERGGVHISARQQGNQLVVSVADTGPGIAPADKERMFRPFEQLDNSIRRRYGGTGLGLAISKSFVELHGGRMWLESELGQGTTFTFSLPIDPPTDPGPGAARWLSADWEYHERVRRTTTRPLRIQPRLLVLDQSQALGRLLGRYMDGREIVPVDSLAQAAQEMARVPAQALLVNEPSVSRTLERLQEIALTPAETPVIVCSVPGMREAAEALGAAEYLIKPLSQDKLLAAIDRLNLPGETLLVVDDEAEASRLYLRMFRAGGRRYHILRATDGEQALQILREQRPDAVLLDLVMPGMDGFRLLEAKGQDPALRDIPVVVISARDPTGQPIVSRAVAVTRTGGISSAQLLECIERLAAVLSPGGSSSREEADGARGGRPEGARKAGG